MFPVHNHSTLRKTRSRRQKTKSTRHHSTQVQHRMTINSSIINRFHEILTDLKRPGSRFSSYTIVELEPICQQIAIQQMSSTTSVAECCPLICIFCQNLIYEPVTLHCGHTYCDQCIRDDQLSSTINCPRCPDDIQGQIQSSVVYAREKSYKKNRFLKELFEHSETLKIKCEAILTCRQGQMEYSKGNYQQAIDIYSKIIEDCKRKISLFFINLFLNFKDNEDHLALYNRAKAYAALEQYDQALNDAARVVTLKPQWAKVSSLFLIGK
jgi:tetratricopeptide (TPR) repeat protein